MSSSQLPRYGTTSYRHVQRLPPADLRREALDGAAGVLANVAQRFRPAARAEFYRQVAEWALAQAASTESGSAVHGQT